ncbi:MULTISPECIES: hypothetical protein [Clostridia]|uniref:hypothetical protein n=1 Tax=Clostridia TaxID=186801 RepID=UPI000E547C48|nr:MULTISPECIES: hypothetical protein [Clostridia]RHV71056.1 hypothetical protein DXB15_03860 [Roseburia sp. OM02-15]
MTVEDVLKNITCGENVCPINIYNNVGKEHTQFEYGDFVNGKVHPSYLREEVDHWTQYEGNGVVSITLKWKTDDGR